MSIRQFLGLSAKPHPTADTETVRRVVEALDNLDPERARFIAAFGYILSRVANADLNIGPGETRAMERTLMDYGRLSAEQAALVVRLTEARAQLYGATENFLVTLEFNRISDREQKLALLNCLFAVCAAEDDISAVEENEIRQITSELGLDHRDFISARSAWKDRLAVLKDIPESSGHNPPADRA